MMTRDASLFAGMLVGLSIAVPIGPMGLLCIQRTLRSGMRIGLSTGLGAATVNVIYGALIILGADWLTPFVTISGRVFNALGGVFLLWSALRTLTRERASQQTAEAVTPSPLAAYASAVAFNATNPLSVILIAALLTPLVGSVTSGLDALVLLSGMFGAASTWWVCLSFGVALLRARVSPRFVGVINRGAGMLLTVYGALALARSAGF
jgi:threonine/homoserine/homoserine lactone efflux protein